MSFVAGATRMALLDAASTDLYLGVWTAGLPLRVDDVAITRSGPAAEVVALGADEVIAITSS